MAHHSKYQDKQFNAMLTDMIGVIEKHQAPTDLSLMVLGNVITELLLQQAGKEQQLALAKAFNAALLNSLNQKR